MRCSVPPVFRPASLIRPEERVDYCTGFRRVARTDPVTRIPLLALKYPKKDGPALLPLESDDPDAFRQSPLAEVVSPDDNVGEIVSTFMGPGPWSFRKDLQLPKVCLHTTNKNRQSNICVSHMLKVIFRVERGDDSALDPQTGKRKLFDIVVQTPVHILSVRSWSLCPALCVRERGLTSPPTALMQPRTHRPPAIHPAPRRLLVLPHLCVLRLSYPKLAPFLLPLPLQI